MITTPNAIVNPGTVMIIAIDASIADVAMTRSWCSDHFTIRTEAIWVKDLEQCDKVNG